MYDILYWIKSVNYNYKVTIQGSLNSYMTSILSFIEIHRIKHTEESK